MKNVYSIIVAGGKGTRFGGDLPKQYLLLNNEPVLMHTLKAFRNVFPVESIITVIAAEMEEFWLSTCERYHFNPGRIVFGGDTRWNSVKNGVESLEGDDAYILVHDAARALVSPSVIRGVLKALEKGCDGALPVVKISDSLREVDHKSSRPVDRDMFRAIQTPQGFPAKILKKAFDLPYSPEFTDEATMVQMAGFGNIVLTEGDERNFKITRPLDLKIARMLLEDEES